MDNKTKGDSGWAKAVEPRDWPDATKQGFTRHMESFASMVNEKESSVAEKKGLALRQAKGRVAELRGLCAPTPARKRKGPIRAKRPAAGSAETAENLGDLEAQKAAVKEQVCRDLDRWAREIVEEIESFKTQMCEELDRAGDEFDEECSTMLAASSDTSQSSARD